MARDPLRGHLFENFVLLELMKARLNLGLEPELYYFRDVHGHEVDLVFRSAHELVPIEIKAAKTSNSEFLKNLEYFQGLCKARVSRGGLIYAGTQEQKLEWVELLNYAHAAKLL